MQLTTSLQIIYKAVVNETVTVTLTNNSSSTINFELYSTSQSFDGNNIAANAESVWTVDLFNGDYIAASAESALDYVITKSGVDITPAPTVNTELTTLKTNATTAVGITTSSLTAAQVRALLNLLLYERGAIDEVTNKIKPLDKWIN